MLIGCGVGASPKTFSARFEGTLYLEIQGDLATPCACLACHLFKELPNKTIDRFLRIWYMLYTRLFIYLCGHLFPNQECNYSFPHQEGAVSSISYQEGTVSSSPTKSVPTILLRMCKYISLRVEWLLGVVRHQCVRPPTSKRYAILLPRQHYIVNINIPKRCLGNGVY